jgi:hypothetical protein
VRPALARGQTHRHVKQLHCCSGVVVNYNTIFAEVKRGPV